MTRSERRVRAAISVTESDDVLVARMSSGGHTWSSFWKIEVFEYPGYVTTRVILPFLNEAMHVVMEGVATPEAVDTSMRLGYGLQVGPLALADRIGLDEVSRWMQYLFEELGDLKYRPCPLLRKMIRAGHLGVKSGRGFFEYDGDGNLKSPSGR